MTNKDDCREALSRKAAAEIANKHYPNKGWFDALEAEGYVITRATIPTQREEWERVREALEYAEYCINAHSERLAVSLEEEGNSEPQFACEATFACDKIEKALAICERSVKG
jgi:hypothetical protein